MGGMGSECMNRNFLVSGGKWLRHTTHVCTCTHSHTHTQALIPQTGCRAVLRGLRSTTQARPWEVSRSHLVSAASTSTKVPANEAGKLGGTRARLWRSRNGCCVNCGASRQGPLSPAAAALGSHRKQDGHRERRTDSWPPSSPFISPLLQGWGLTLREHQSKLNWGQPQETCQWSLIQMCCGSFRRCTWRFAVAVRVAHCSFLCRWGKYKPTAEQTCLPQAEAPEMKARCCHSEGRRSGGWFSRTHSKVFIPEIHFMSLNFKYIFGFLTLCWKLETQKQVTVTSALWPQGPIAFIASADWTQWRLSPIIEQLSNICSAWVKSFKQYQETNLYWFKLETSKLSSWKIYGIPIFSYGQSFFFLTLHPWLWYIIIGF